MSTQTLLAKASGLDWKSHLFFVFLVLIPAIIIGISTAHLFPDMMWMTVLLMIVIVGVAFITHRYADEPVPWVAQLGIIAAFILGIFLYLSLVAHIGYTRELSASKSSVAERHVEEDRALAREKERVQMQSQLADAESKRLEATRRTLVQVPVKQRPGLLSRLGMTGPPAPAATPEPSQTPAAQSPTDPVAIQTPEQVRASWSGWLMLFLILDCGAAIVGGSIVWGARAWDANGNGLPDFIEEIAHNTSELEFARQRPKDYAKYGSKLKFAGGKA